MSAARSVVECAEVYGRAAVNALVLDDWKALTSAHSTPLQRLEAAADLASWAIPEGKIAELAGHAIAKAAEVASQHLAASAVAEHIAAAGATVVNWANRTKNETIAQQPPWNKSKIWDRPLTDLERAGTFETAEDAKAFLGPASERGVQRDWHHVVESQAEKQFGAERVHSIKNLGAIERDPAHGEVSAAFSRSNRQLGGQSLRDYLKDKPWEQHVRSGERELLKHGIDPVNMRSQTLERFNQRIELHDRLLGISKEKRVAEIVVAGTPTAIAGRGVSSQNGELSTNRASVDAPRLQARDGGSSVRDNARPLSVERDGHTTTVSPGYTQQGRILSINGDRIVQDVGRGHSAMYSRKELEADFGDSQAFHAMVQPGNYIHVGVGRNGEVDIRQQVPGHGWESLGDRSLSRS